MELDDIRRVRGFYGVLDYVSRKVISEHDRLVAEGDLETAYGFRNISFLLDAMALKVRRLENRNG